MTHAYVYILRCADNSLYTGYTPCLERRLQQHQAGKGAKYTQVRLPVELVWHRECSSARIARQWEYRIKQLTKQQKELLILPESVAGKKLLEQIRQLTDEAVPLSTENEKPSP